MDSNFSVSCKVRVSEENSAQSVDRNLNTSQKVLRFRIANLNQPCCYAKIYPNAPFANQFARICWM